MKKFILVFTLFITGNLFSQVPNYNWAKNFGGADVDKSHAICTGSSGNVYVTGTFKSATLNLGSYTLTNSSSEKDVFISKMDTDGNVLWANSITGLANEESFSVCSDLNENIYVTGNFNSDALTFGSFVINKPGANYDMFLAKYDADGNFIWAKVSTNGTSVAGKSVTTDSDGNVLVAGIYEGLSVDFELNTLLNSDGTGITKDLFIVKYDQDGILMWTKSAIGSDSEDNISVSVDINKNVLLTGSFLSSTLTFDSFILTNSASTFSDIFVVKYDSFGVALWANSIEGEFDDVAGSIVTDLSGEIYVTGSYVSSVLDFGNTTINTAGNINSFLAKFNSGGLCVWARKIETTDDLFSKSLTLTSYGSIYVVGNVSVFTFPLNSFITEYDNFGNLLWFKNELGNKYDEAESITADNNGNIFILGNLTSTNDVSYGSDLLTNTTSNEMYVLKIDQCSDRFSTINVTICESYTSPSGLIYTESGFILDTIPSTNSCDSIITINLTILNSSTSLETVAACKNYEWNNVNYTNSGFYTIVLTNSIGCDSLASLNLTIYNNISLVDNVITSSTSGALYQWVDCNNNFASISGETSQSITLQQEGYYALVFTGGTCISDTTACIYYLDESGIDESNTALNVKIFPNPTNGTFKIDLGSLTDEVKIEISDLSGRIVSKQKYMDQKVIEIDLNEESGIYYVKVENRGNSTNNIVFLNK